MAALGDQIKAKASNLGFSFCGFTEIEVTPHLESYLEWIKNGFHGQMAYLEKEYVRLGRSHPPSLLEGAKSAIVVGMHYQPNEKNQPNEIASYALYEDYHLVIRKQLLDLLNWVQKEHWERLNYRVFIDSGPVMEKDFARKAGLGSIGKNSLFYHPEFGSYVLIGCAFTNLQIKTDHTNLKDICGNCEICIQSCPTGCILNNRTIDARKCISYLTAEQKERIPQDFHRKMNGWALGCDICQNVCPINKNLIEIKSSRKPVLELLIKSKLDLISEINLSEFDFQRKYERTVLSRLTHESYIRNLLICMGNSQSKEYLPILKKFQSGHRSQLIKEHANWAIEAIQDLSF